MTKSEARRRGGLVNYSRYGHEGMVARGKKGGRPRLPTLEEIRQHQSPKAQNNKKEVSDSLEATNSLTELKRLWNTAARSRRSISNKEGPGDPIARAPGGGQHE